MLILEISLSIFVELLHTVTQLDQTVGIKTSCLILLVKNSIKIRSVICPTCYILTIH